MLIYCNDDVCVSVERCVCVSSARDQSQPLDAAVLHLFPPHRQFLCVEHVCGCGGGELSQVSSASGGGGGQTQRGETTQEDGEEETQ